jgi:C4-type Zn-finger protein
MWPKRGEPKRKVEYVETCPKCASRKVTHHFGLSAYTCMGIMYVYECPDCGYRGINVGLSPLEEAPSHEGAEAGR